MFCRSGRIFVDKMVQQTTEEKHVSIFCHPLQRRASCLVRALLFSSDFFPLSVIFFKKRAAPFIYFAAARVAKNHFQPNNNKRQSTHFVGFCF